MVSCENSLKRSKSYIFGFDKLVEGGFPDGSSILVNGSPGAGKTIFSLQYLVNGAINDNEKGIYFTFEEKKEALFLQAKQFGWDLEDLEKEGRLKIISIGINLVDKYSVSDMAEIIHDFDAKRVVVDSITTLSFLVDNTLDYSSFNIRANCLLFKLIDRFKKISGLNLLLISQKDAPSTNFAEFICDGLLEFSSESLGGNYSRNLSIKKMRNTKNDSDLHPIEICDEGIKIHTFF